MTIRAWTAFAILCVIWGFPYFLMKIALTDFSPACIAWGRVTLAALILAPIAWRRGVLKPVLKHKAMISLFALAELVVPFFSIALGEQWISSSLAGILVATVPLTVVVLAPFFGVRDRLGVRRVIGLAVGFTGVVALLGLDPGHGPLLWAGVLALSAAVLGYTIGPLIVQRHLSGVDELGAVAASLVVASMVLAPFAAATAPSHIPSATSLSAVLVLGVVCTALALWMFFWLISTAGAARATLVAYVNPAVAALLGVFILNEPFGVGSVLGFIMILVGSWLASGREKLTADAQPSTGSA